MVKERKQVKKPQARTTMRGLFWEHKTVEQLAAEQGVDTTKDLDEIMGKYWPEDADFESFLEAVRSARR